MSNLLECTLEGPRNVESFVKLEPLEKVKAGVEFNIKSVTDAQFEFDLIGVDVSVANSLRRIMISEVPTMAIETVQLFQNTGVIQDEVLCQRIGLIPFKVNPDDFEFRSAEMNFSSKNSLKFTLHVICPQTTKVLPIYSRELRWVAQSEEEEKEYTDNIPRPVHDDILITKLGPGQEIELICFLEKGCGKTHAKWSPACPAFYCLKPILALKVDAYGKKATLTDSERKELVELCPGISFDEETGEIHDIDNSMRYRACIERFPTKLSYFKIKDHYQFSIESTGCIPAEKIFRDAIKVLMGKLKTFKTQLPTTENLSC